MTPAARITAALLLLMIVISLGYLFNHQLGGPDEVLFGGEAVSSDQIPAMEGAFAKANLSGYQIDGGRIRVTRGQRAAYMAALVDGNALPQVIGGPLKKSMSEGSILGTTKAKQEEMHRIAIQEELMLVIRSMRGIEKASVLIDSEVDGGLTRHKTLTASVSVKPVGNQPLEEDRVPMLRQFVAAAVAGLSPESVAVTDLNTGRTFAGDNAGGNGVGLADRYIAVKRAHEHEWEDKIRSALSYIPGVIVAANVDLIPELEHHESSTKVDAKTATLMRKENTSTQTQQSGGSGGRPGLVAQGGVNQPAAVSSAANNNHSQQETSNVEEHNVAPTTVTDVVSSPLAPQRVTVSVSIPSSYVERLWQERNPPPAGQEPKKPDRAGFKDIETEIVAKIKTHLNGLLPEKESTDGRPKITVTTFQQLASDPLPSVSIADSAMTWLGQSWTTLGMGMLGVFSLVMLRSMVRGGDAPPAPLPMSPAAAAAAAAEAVAEKEQNQESPAPEAQPKRKRRAQAGPTLKDDLIDIVREDPDAAANILRTWIGSGA
ncbi:MAG TPA: hypothetical protein VFE24_16555 [Pirellulales bacterium]|nr:hypothetical protein [Pirellulales bacterium]